MSEHITEQRLELEALLAQTESPDCGALVVFAGTVRVHNDGREVASIEYSAYAPLAEKALAEIEQETLRRFDITRCEIRHRIGAMQVGDMSVVVVVRAAHRAAAFEAGRYAIDTVKQRAPIWKHEAYTDGSRAYVQGHALTDDAGRDAGDEPALKTP
jgi:molybdopterin synthase catalytic subunit